MSSEKYDSIFFFLIKFLFILYIIQFNYTVIKYKLNTHVILAMLMLANLVILTKTRQAFIIK